MPLRNKLDENKTYLWWFYFGNSISCDKVNLIGLDMVKRTLKIDVKKYTSRSEHRQLYLLVVNVRYRGGMA